MLELLLLPMLLQFAAGGPQAAPPQAAQQPTVPAITLPTIVVTARKEPAEAQRLPVSVTAVTLETIEAAGMSTVSEAAVWSPNTRVAELSARRVSNPFVRGIGSSPANPGITTFIDGVPQLNSSSSSIELLDVEQIEVVRGPQSALFGRNTLGGLVSLASARPSLQGWNGRLAVPFGSAGARDVRASASGPLGGSLAVGVSYGHGERDGFTVNDVTGNLVDSRSADFGKAQVLWVPSPQWEARAIVYGERARDGDYALNDLEELRRRPFHTARDFEGHTQRDLWSATALLRREGKRVSFSSTTGYVSWDTDDATDLDYSPMPLVTRRNAEDQRQFTQEFRLASAPGAPARLSAGAVLSWQAGLFLFTQDYAQDAVNTFAPFVLSPALPVAVDQHSPLAALDDAGLGAYGQGTLNIDESWDLSVGARLDTERKSARIDTYYEPLVAPPTAVDAERTFTDVSPQASLAYRAAPGRTVYGSAGRGFKAGGFNAASPPGSEAYGEERAWNLEAGLKTTWMNGRLSVNAAAFRIIWDDMQLNVPNPVVPAQFYIANVGGARSSGLEMDVSARPAAGIDLYASGGLTRARFEEGSAAGGVDVSGNDLPNAPRYTLAFGTQLSRAVGGGSLCYGRADVVFSGAYHYDEANLEGQDAYSLVNLRVGVKARGFVAEAWVKNAFDTRYIPVAFAYGGLAPSGFVGENGHPRTFGVSVGFAF
ncbi:MAG: TonB-dependent receptor [Acidobacteria bacterium]|nr:TonB-dependent receptor [Acidobacteriota bacterium]